MEDNMFLQNVGIDLQIYAAPKPNQDFNKKLHVLNLSDTYLLLNSL
jgi:hypothetical protein